MPGRASTSLRGLDRYCPHTCPILTERRALLARRLFHASRAQRADDHYAVLNLDAGASLAEIKKSFYSLSKIHHPDRNPDNHAEASKKFSAISDAYHILSDPKQRDKYDRELERQNGIDRESKPAAGRSGFSPGGRKASGLSRRRGTFRGPPPSFYRSGGWGEAGEKREGNMGTDPRTANARQEQQQQQQQQQQHASGGPYGGATGAWPFASDVNDVPHFHREAHYRTQTTVEEQLKKGRRRRRSVFLEQEDMVDDGGEGGSLGKFLQVCGIVVVGIGMPLVLLSGGVG